MMETYFGIVRNPADAIKLFEACRMGQLPRVQRRLSEKERQSIRSGSIFVWDEREAGMRRWTDGRSWSASRVAGSFLTYREMEGKRGGGFGNGRRGGGKTPDSSGRGSDEDQEDCEPDGYKYKVDGLMKQSFSITTSTGQHLHLISYYARPGVGPVLQQPTTDPSLRHILPAKGLYPESSLPEASGPAMTRAPMQARHLPAMEPPMEPPSYSTAAQQAAAAPPVDPAPYPGLQQQQPPPTAGQLYAYALPPTPMGTPPYSQYAAPGPYAQQGALPAPASHYQPQQHYGGGGAAATHERGHLPSLGADLQRRTTPPGHGPYSQPPMQQRPLSPHTLHARATASRPQQEAQDATPIDPRLMGGASLPSIMATGPTRSPPPRGMSVSPHRPSQPDVGSNGVPAGSRTSLSALLHPTPASSEPNGASNGSGSAGNSPRQHVIPTSASITQTSQPAPLHEAARTVSALNKKFYV